MAPPYTEHKKKDSPVVPNPCIVRAKQCPDNKNITHEVVVDEVVAALGERKLVRDPAPVWSHANLT